MRGWLLGGFLAFCVFQVGCQCRPDFCGGGCGEKYWGAYCDDPPRCEPCDCYGNWTGGCGDCGSKYPWVRSRGKRSSFIKSVFGCDRGCGGCTEPNCGEPACGEPTCEPTCAPACEPSCGEPGCGQASCGCGQAHLTSYSSRSPRRNSSMQMVSRPTTVDYRMAAPQAPCNCKH